MKREIVILSRSLPFHGFGGMEIVAWDLAREFSRSGYLVRVITTSIPGREGEFEQEGVRIIPLCGTPSRRYSSVWWTASRQYFEQNCLKTTQAVLSVSAAAFSILPLKKKLPGVTFIMQAHGSSWGEVISKWRSHRFKAILSSALNLLWLPKDLLSYPKFDVVVAIGERVYRDLTTSPASWTLPKSKVRLINNGIDTSIFRPSIEGRRATRIRLGLAEDTPVLISASRLHAQKGVVNTLRAFALLLKDIPKAMYLIAGDGPERANLEAICSELGISDHVKFLGTLDRPELAKTLQAGDAFIFLTERVEGLPLNIMEALASGLPAVVSEHLCLFPSPAIHLLPPRDCSSVKSCIYKLLTKNESQQPSQLPNEFELTHSSQKYLDSINRTRTT